MCILHHKARYNLHITFLMRPLYPKCHSLFCSVTSSALVWHTTYPTDGTLFGKGLGTQTGCICLDLGPVLWGTRLCLWTPWPMAGTWLRIQKATAAADPSPPAQITYQTLILFKSVITEQNWVPAPCVYFLIRCLANRRPQFEFTRTQCPSSWPALVTGRSSQPLGAQVVVITALFHLRSGYGFRLFCPPLKMDVQEKALNEFVSHDTRLFPLLSIPFPSKTLSGMISVPCKKAQIIF